MSEERLGIHYAEPFNAPSSHQQPRVFKVQEPEKLIQLIEQLEFPELFSKTRLDITSQMRGFGKSLNIPVDIVTSTKKTVNVDRFYNTERLRPKFESFEMTPLFIMTSDGV